MLSRLQECSRQVEAEVVSNSRNKLHQTWKALFWRPLYYICLIIDSKDQWFGDSAAKVAGSCECRGMKEFDEDSVGCGLSAEWWVHLVLISSGVALAVGLVCAVIVMKFTYKYGSGFFERIVVLPN